MDLLYDCHCHSRNQLIDYIKVYEGGNISVKFKYADEFRRMAEYIELNAPMVQEAAGWYIALLPNPFAGFPNIYCPYVDTVGRNKKVIEEYIKNQLQEDKEYEQLTMDEMIDPFTGESNKKANKKSPC